MPNTGADPSAREPGPACRAAPLGFAIRAYAPSSAHIFERDDDQERLAAQREAAIAVRAHPRLAARTPLSDCHASRWLVRLRAGRPPRWGSKEDQAKRERSLSHPSLFRQTDRSGDEFDRPVGKYPLAEPAKAATGRARTPYGASTSVGGVASLVLTPHRSLGSPLSLFLPREPHRGTGR